MSFYIALCAWRSSFISAPRICFISASRSKIFLPYSNLKPFTAIKILSIQKQFADNRKKVLLMTQRHELYYPQEVSCSWRNTGQFHKAIWLQAQSQKKWGWQSELYNTTIKKVYFHHRLWAREAAGIKRTKTLLLSLIHIWRCRRYSLTRSRWSPYH